ncbi:hypothetical protein ACFFHH_15075 [Cytobacillus solani]|nr:hypothetical protein [Cytobacillus solani]
MIVKKIGEFSIQKDGSSFYRVFNGRKRIGSFLLLSDAEKYYDKKRLAIN